MIEQFKDFARDRLTIERRQALRQRLGALQGYAPRHKFSFDGAPAKASPSPYDFMVAPDDPLSELGRKFQPSKVIANYLPYYWMHFRDIRESVKNVLEIGVQTDGSIRMWEEFFPNATITGIDILPECADFAGGRRRIAIGSQSDPSFLRRVVDDTDGPFDIVIDDGSHHSKDQIASFEFLYPRLSEHGIYVIEDTGLAYGDYSGQAVKSLKDLVDSVMYWPSGLEASHWRDADSLEGRADWKAQNTVGIAFYRWIAFVMRGRNPQDNPFVL